MKQYLVKILLVMLSIVIFTMGLGANVFNFCCEDCESQITLISDIACCSVHEHTNNVFVKSSLRCEDLNCTVTYNNTDSAKQINNHIHNSEDLCIADNLMHCSVSRLSIDLSMPIDKVSVNIPFVWLNDFLPILVNLKLFSVENVIATSFMYCMPEIHPRTYLSLIRVLII